MTNLQILINELVQLAYQEHYFCEDSWYSCPADPNGCSNDSREPGVCACGADEHNAKINALRDQLNGTLEEIDNILLFR